MSAYLQTINLYKQEGYEIRTSMNPMHFSISEAFLRVFSTDIPFTHALSKDICLELRAGGGDKQYRIILLRKSQEHNTGC